MKAATLYMYVCIVLYIMHVTFEMHDCVVEMCTCM